MSKVLWKPGTTVYPLWYGQQVLGLREDVDVVSNIMIDTFEETGVTPTLHYKDYCNVLF